MSDLNPDVAPNESVVDLPSDNPSPEAAQEVGNPSDSAAEGLDLDEPVSLDAIEDEGNQEGEPEGEDDGEGAETPEVIEFDFGGNKMAIPKGAVPEELAQQIDKFSKDIWADYTKKSQVNADQAKALKARTEVLEKIETLGGEALNAFTRGKSIKAEIEQLSTVNLQQLWQSNPDRARQVSDTLAAKQAELQGIIQTVDQYEHAITNERQVDLARRADEGKQLLDRKYKGFSGEIAPKLERYVQENGISADEATQWSLSPVIAEFAYKAMLYDQMRAAGKPKAAPKSTPSPVKSMKGGVSSKSTDPNKMSMAEIERALGYR